MYSEKVLDHFHHPRNVGEIAEPTATVEATNPVCGDLLRLWVVVREKKISEVKFKIEGCIPAIACGSWLTEAIKSRSLAELASLSASEIAAGVGGLPPSSRHASGLASEALKELLAKLRP